jgi:hypothetical protein
MNLCVPKAVRDLNVVLNTQRDLGLRRYSVDINLIAELPFPAGPPPRVKWNVNENLNLDLGYGATLKGIKGSISAEFQEIAPRSPGFACDGSPRAVAASFQTAGTENELDLFVDTLLVGDWRLKNIQLMGGTVAEPLGLGTWDVSIRPRPQGGIYAYECRVWARQGQAVWFDAVVSNLPADATVAYEWTFPGGTATGSSVLVTLPPSSLTITVTAMVTLLGQTITKQHSLSVTTFSPEEADAFEIGCRLRNRLQEYMKITPLLPGSQNKVRGFVDPYWDGVPFFRADGTAVTRESLQELLVATERIRMDSASLAESLGRALSRGEK